jgi:hypothetical protein
LIMKDPDKRIDTRPMNAHPIGHPPTGMRGPLFVPTTKRRQWGARISLAITSLAALAGWAVVIWG